MRSNCYSAGCSSDPSLLRSFLFLGIFFQGRASKRGLVTSLISSRRREFQFQLGPPYCLKDIVDCIRNRIDLFSAIVYSLADQAFSKIFALELRSAYQRLVAQLCRHPMAHL